MVSEDGYCIDTLAQMSAVQSTLHTVALGLLEDHMDHCVINAVEESGEAEREKIQEATHAITGLVGS